MRPGLADTSPDEVAESTFAQPDPVPSIPSFRTHGRTSTKRGARKSMTTEVRPARCHGCCVNRMPERFSPQYGYSFGMPLGWKGAKGPLSAIPESNRCGFTLLRAGLADIPDIPDVGPMVATHAAIGCASGIGADFARCPRARGDEIFGFDRRDPGGDLMRSCS